MARPRSPNRDRAKMLWLESGKKRMLKDIAEELQVSEEQVRKWKNQDKWDKVTLPNANSNVTNRKGGQPGNRNAVGHGGIGPPGNKNAEKYGFFSKYLPEETREIFSAIEQADPLDLLWHQIQIAYAAIIRAQRIAYVRDQNDKTIEKVEEKKGKIIGEKWEVQQAWDKQNEFLKAQARAQGELRALIKQYDEMLHKNWDLVTDEQKSRIAQIKAQTERLSAEPTDGENDGVEIINDADENASQNIGHSTSEIPADIQR